MGFRFGPDGKIIQVDSEAASAPTGPTFLVDPESGNVVQPSPEDAIDLRTDGYRDATSDEVAASIKKAEAKAKYSTPLESAKAFGEGALDAASMGLSTEAETNLLGVDPEAIKEREKLPAHGLGTFTGITAPLLLTGGLSAEARAAAMAAREAGGLGAAARTAAEFSGPSLAAKAGHAITGALESTAPASGSLLARTGRQAAASAIGSAAEGAFYGTGQLIHEHAIGDANLNAENLVATAGPMAVLMGAGGAILGGAGVLLPEAVQALRRTGDVVGDVARKGWIQGVMARTGATEEDAAYLWDNRQRLAQISLEDMLRERRGGAPEKPVFVPGTKPERPEIPIPVAPEPPEASIAAMSDALTEQLGAHRKTMMEAGMKIRPAEIDQLFKTGQFSDAAGAIGEDAEESMHPALQALDADILNAKSTPGLAADEMARDMIREREELAASLDQSVRRGSITREMDETVASKVAEMNDAYKELSDNPDKYGGKKAGAQLLATIEGLQKRIVAVPESIFAELKQAKDTLSGLIRFDGPMGGLDREAKVVLKGLRHSLRTALEDESVFGEAAVREREYNRAFHEAAGAEKDFRRKFASKVSAQGYDELVADPKKVKTFLHLLGKPENKAMEDVFWRHQNAIRALYDEVAKSAETSGYNFDREALDKLRQSTRSVFSHAADAAKETRQFEGAAASRRGKMSDFAEARARFTQTEAPRKQAFNQTREDWQSAVKAQNRDVKAASQALRGHARDGWSPWQYVNPLHYALSNPLRAVRTLAAIERTSQAVGRKIGAMSARLAAPIERAELAAKGAVQIGASKVLADDRQKTQRQYMKQAEQLRLYANNPAPLMHALGQSGAMLAQHAPDTAQAASAVQARAVNFLASKLPVGPSQTYGRPWTPSASEVAKFNRYRTAVESPMDVLKAAGDGSLTPESVEALQAVYPRLYRQIQVAVLTEAGKHPDMPYRSRMVVSMLLGTPTDASMRPDSIMAAQAMFAPPQQKAPTPPKPPASEGKVPNSPWETETQRTADRALN